MNTNLKRETFNQIINFFWTILCFTPVFWFWIETGINNAYFYSFLAVSFIIGLLPEKLLDQLTFSPRRGFYERIGVKLIRKFVQNGDAVSSMSNSRDNPAIRGRIQAKRYLKTIAMYERYHWICLSFFLLTSFYCLANGYLKFAILITIANLLYNLSPILLQQYNKIRIKKMI